MKLDFKELGINLVVVILALVLYYHVVSPMISKNGKKSPSVSPETV